MNYKILACLILLLVLSSCTSPVVEVTNQAGHFSVDGNFAYPKIKWANIQQIGAYLVKSRIKVHERGGIEHELSIEIDKKIYKRSESYNICSVIKSFAWEFNNEKILLNFFKLNGSNFIVDVSFNAGYLGEYASLRISTNTHYATIGNEMDTLFLNAIRNFDVNVPNAVCTLVQNAQKNTWQLSKMRPFLAQDSTNIFANIKDDELVIQTKKFDVDAKKKLLDCFDFATQLQISTNTKDISF